MTAASTDRGTEHTAAAAPDSRGRNRRGANPLLEKLGGFPVSGGVSPLGGKSRLGSNSRISRFLLRDSGAWQQPREGVNHNINKLNIKQHQQ